MKKIISGIQQIGIGNPNTPQAWKWYRKAFGMDVPIFDEAAVAALMLPYTGGEARSRHAVLAMNLQGGGGFEIWQYTSRKSEPADFEIQAGDLGIFVAKIKSRDVEAAFRYFKAGDFNLLSELEKDPQGKPHFFVQDPYKNIFQVVEGEGWFSEGKHVTGGLYGAIIGATDIEKSKKFYADILGYDKVIYDEKRVFNDFKSIPGGEFTFRRVLLTHSKPRVGAFSKLLGPSQIELIQVFERKPRKIFENRFWGDIGFIHLCFDVYGMATIQEECEAAGRPFTVDSSNSFDMGEAAGHFTYIEDPDGALIEFVETHKIPIMKKLGWYLDLKKRDHTKALPNFIIKALGLGRVKD